MVVGDNSVDVAVGKRRNKPEQITFSQVETKSFSTYTVCQVVARA